MPTNTARVSPHKEYHTKHRCEKCGCRLEQHAGPNNPHAPDASCPRTVSWATPAQFPRFSLSDEDFNKACDVYWQTAGTTFEPI